MREKLVKKILNDTEEGYDLVAGKFSQTRNRFWKELEFINKFAKGDGRILDFGCGNGRLTEILKNKNIDYVGVDVSEKLINSAKFCNADRSGFQKVNFLKIESDFKHLPFPADYFDVIYSIAVFHHIPSYAKRLAVAQELYRLTKKGGYVVITVWDLWQSGHKKNYRKNIFKNWKDKILNQSELDWNDCWITFADNNGQIFKRFHHAFTKLGLKNLFRKSGFDVLNCKVIKGNIVLIGKRCK
jgi:ubiquinone/menaquinone biosynthesis C-methylase UbiE